MSHTAEEYARAFHAEQAKAYPQIDSFELACGHAIDKGRLEEAARVLACPVKAHGANWQHGRVLYAAVKMYLETADTHILCLDIGTAKGFSALCMRWALEGASGRVVSLDVLDPAAKVKRNTVAEVDGYLTLAETLSPWPESKDITFLRQTGIDWLTNNWERVNVAYVDGKHTYEVVSQEAVLLANQQKPGDIVIFDDVQIDGVSRALAGARKWYDFTGIALSPLRAYAVGIRRG